MIANLTYYDICWYFLLYSFLGWVVEVCYQAMTKAKIVNRGFLNGPVCPVYGLGALDKRLAELDDIQRQMRVLSDRMSEQIGENALEAAQRLQKAKVQGALGRAELREDLEERRKELAENLQNLRKQAEARYRTLYASRHFGVGRFLLAFPTMRHSRYDHIVEELKDRFSQK